MFSTCRTLQTGLMLLALGACSKEPAQPTPSGPLVTAPARPQDASTGAQPSVSQTVSSHVNATGVAATYDATFVAGQLQRIDEQRADAHRGEYQFRGARLLHYRGSGLSSADAIELRFGLQGALTFASAGAKPVPAEEISAIRQRAQLLRSHALAQKSTQEHQ
jgi:hypothetical protein